MYCPRRQVGGIGAAAVATADVAASFAPVGVVPPAVVERGKEFWTTHRSGDVVGRDGEDDAFIVTGTGA